MQDEDKSKAQLIADLRQQNAELKTLVEEGGLLRALIDSSPDYIYIKDTQGRFIIGNAAVARVMGAASPDALIGKTDFDFYPHELAAKFFADEQQIIHSGQPLINHQEPRTDQPSGASGWTSTTKVPYRDENGNIIGIVGIGRDITARKQTEEALRQSEARLAGILDIAMEAVITTDEDQRIIIFNKGAEAIFGYTAEEAIGQPLDLLMPVSSRVAHRKYIVEFAESPETARTMAERHEIRGLRKNGEEFPAAASISKLRLGGQPVFTAVLHDITERKRQEKQLRESEERSRRLLESIYDMVHTVDSGGRFLSVNRAWLEITGYSEEDLAELTLWDIIHPDAHEYCRQKFAAIMGGTPVANLQTTFIGKDGRLIELEGNAAAGHSTNGVVSHAFFRDVTERNRAARALRASEERYRITTELISDYAYSCCIQADGTRTIEWLTEDSFQRLTGYAYDETSNNYELYHPDDAARARQHVEQTVRGQPTWGEYRIITKDGEQRWLYIQREPIWNEQGDRVVRFYGVAQDITERRQAEYREQYLGQILESSLNEMYIFDAQTLRLINVNRGGRNNLGYSMDELRELTPLDIKPELTPAQFAELLEPLRTGEREQVMFETVHRRKDGTQYPVEVHLQLSSLASSPVFVALILDTTLRKEAEALQREKHKLEVALEKERELQQIKSRFVSMVSHDFRNPLAAIQLNVELLKKHSERMDEAKKTHRFDRIHAQIQHLTSLVDDVLLIGEAESEGLSFNPTRLNLHHLCRPIVEDFQESAKATHTFAYTCSNDCQEAILDESRMRQILINLVSNAVKYSPEGGEVAIRVTCDEESLTLQVQDEGIGIPDNDQKHLFEAFHRATNVGRLPGTGLGLVVVHHAVTLHGGTISVESTEGVGTTFTVHLPRYQ